MKTVMTKQIHNFDFRSFILDSYKEISPSLPEYRLVFGYSSVTSKVINCQITLNGGATNSPNLSIFHRDFSEPEKKCLNIYYIYQTSKMEHFSSEIKIGDNPNNKEILRQILEFIDKCQNKSSTIEPIPPRIEHTPTPTSQEEPKQAYLLQTIFAVRELVQHLLKPTHIHTLSGHVRDNILLYLNGFMYQAHDYDIITAPKLELVTLGAKSKADLKPFSKKDKTENLTLILRVAQIFESFAPYNSEHIKIAELFLEMHEEIKQNYEPTLQ